MTRYKPENQTQTGENQFNSENGCNQYSVRREGTADCTGIYKYLGQSVVTDLDAGDKENTTNNDADIDTDAVADFVEWARGAAAAGDISTVQTVWQTVEAAGDNYADATWQQLSQDDRDMLRGWKCG